MAGSITWGMDTTHVIDECSDQDRPRACLRTHAFSHDERLRRNRKLRKAGDGRGSLVAIAAFVLLVIALPIARPPAAAQSLSMPAAAGFGAAMCTPSGGAPGLSLNGLPPGGAIGPGAAGSGSEAFVDALTGSSPPAPPVCKLSGADGEPASLPVDEVERQAGNPVDVVTGNKYLRQIDVLLPDVDAVATASELPGAQAGGAAMALQLAAAGAVGGDALRFLFSRHYNSRSDFALSLGRGWSHGFDTRLARLSRGGRVELQIVQGDGRRIVFDRLRNAAPASAIAPTTTGRADEASPPLPAAVFGSGALVDGWVYEYAEHPGQTEAFIWHWPGGRRLGFDSIGRLVSVTAANRDALRLRYDGNGRLVAIDDTSGRRLLFEYDGPRLSALRLPDGLRIEYGYDEHGRLVQVRYPDGRRLHYHYEDPRAFQLLTGVTDAAGRRSRYEYDELMRVAMSRAAGQPQAQALHFSYRLPLSEGAVGITEISVGQTRTRYRWIDELRRHRPRLLGAEGDGCAMCPPVGLRVAHDASGRRVSIDRQRLRLDAFGRIAERRIVDDAGRTVWRERLFYDDDRNLLAPPSRIERSSVVPGRIVTIASRRRSDGQLAEVTLRGFAPARLPDDAANHAGERAAARRRAGAASASHAAEPLLASLRLVYQESGPAFGKLAAIERVGDDGTAIRTSFHYDQRRRLIRIEHGGILQHEIERDELGRVLAERLPDGRRQTRDYDRHWRLANASTPAGAMRIDYDRIGRPRSIAWLSGERWSFELHDDGAVLVSNHGWRRIIGKTDASTAQSAVALPVALARTGAGRTSLVDVGGGRSERLYDDLGRLVLEYTSAAGLRRYRFDALGRLRRIEYADGAVDRREYDAADRITLREQSLAGERIETRLRYEGARLVGIDHPAQQATARHDEHGRLVELVRVLAGGGDAGRTDAGRAYTGRTHRQQFIYDDRGLLREQHLSDGSRLLHGYDAQGRHQRLGWLAPGAAKPIWIVAGVEYRPGTGHLAELRYGNGTRLERDADAAGRPLHMRWRGASVAATAASALPFRRFEWHRSGLPIVVAGEHGEDRYGFDGFGRLIIRERHVGETIGAAGSGAAGSGAAGSGAAGIGAASLGAAGGAGEPLHVEYFAYEATGARLAAKTRSGPDWRAADEVRNAAGLPLRYGGRQLDYGPQRRIVGVHAGESTVARYRYNALGERVYRDNGGEAIGFLHREQMLEAETDTQGRLRRHYLRWKGRIVAIVDVDPDASSAADSALGRRHSIAWLHHDHLGTPLAATDAAGRIIWRADYDAYGHAIADGPLRQPLRFAGQYFDAETGLHDNYQRTYDPAAGRYLEPDPLGLAAGFDPYGYADGNPLLANDPLGLILFAFDGTKNGSAPQGVYDQSNVWKFFDNYDDPNKWYMTGVGLDDPGSGIRTNALDAINANTAAQRVDYMLGTLDSFLDERWRGQQVPLDVVGFSRGAAMARDFVNRVAARMQEQRYLSRGICLDLRFLGLWDTVAMFGFDSRSPRRWQLAIPSAVRATFHAVALNEHRGNFPLESALSDGAYVIERGFIGGHSDVGGSESEGDLSDIALVWMVEMAKRMKLPMKELSPSLSTVSLPLVHDRNDDGLGDRDTIRRLADGRIASAVAQRNAVVPGMNWKDSNRFIAQIRPRRMDAAGGMSIVGVVNMKMYADWLRENYGITIAY